MKYTARFTKAARKKVGLSQGKLAKALGYSSPQFVSNVERKISLWPADRVRLVADLLDIPIPKLIWAYTKDMEEMYRQSINDYKKSV